MSNLSKRTEEPQRRVGFELHKLLDSLHLLRILTRRLPGPDRVLGTFEDMTLMQVLEQDAILRLCKLDDDDNRNWSLRQFARVVRCSCQG